MDGLFIGYVKLNGKKCAQKLKDASYLTLEQAKKLDGYGGVLAADTILVDVDDEAQSEQLMDIVEAEQVACMVVQTTRGKHFYFKGYPRGTKCRTHARLAIGIDADIKVGSKACYGALKVDGIEREMIYDVFEDEEYDELPCWLRPVQWSPDFEDMGEGDGRNQSLFNYILTLQGEGFSHDEARATLSVINRHMFDKPMSQQELEVVYRDDAFAEDVFYNKGTFLFDKFAEYLRNEHRIVKIGHTLHVYYDGVYASGNLLIENAMIKHLPMLSKAKRTEVLNYLDVLIQDDAPAADADYIAFANGIYDLKTDSLVPFSPEFVITNKIPWEYDSTIWSELADKTLRRLACDDQGIYDLLEEVIGYLFYRRNELRKSFILLGDKANGKSTYLDMLKTLLGDGNTSALDLSELGERFKTAELFGKLANVGDDIGDEFIANPAVFKKLVSGDRVNAERKGQDPFDFSSYAKLLFSANSMPRIRDKTGAVLDRIVLVPFKAQFSKDDPDFDPYIKYKLRSPEVMSHLINIGLKGLERVLANRSFTMPEAVEVELEAYAVANNPILDFFHETPVDEVVNESTASVYDDYVSYAIRNNVKPLGQNEFTRQANKYYGITSKTVRVNRKRVRLFVEV